MAFTDRQRDLLHALGYLFLVHGRIERAIRLLEFATAGAPDHTGLCRTLALAYLADDRPRRALETIDRLDDAAGGSRSIHILLRCRALLLMKRTDEARQLFPEFVKLKKAEVE